MYTTMFCESSSSSSDECAELTLVICRDGLLACIQVITWPVSCVNVSRRVTLLIESNMLRTTKPRRHLHHLYMIYHYINEFHDQSINRAPTVQVDSAFYLHGTVTWLSAPVCLNTADQLTSQKLLTSVTADQSLAPQITADQ